MMSKQKVSFDFDGTLDQQKVQEYAKLLIEQYIEVHIITSRYEDITKYDFDASHDDLMNVAMALNIPLSQIHFTNFVDKATWFIENPEYAFIWHLDNDDVELDLIRNNCDVLAIDVTNSDWSADCNLFLDIHNEINNLELDYDILL